MQATLVAAEVEVRKEKAREAHKILATFRKRGAEIDNGLRKLLQEYMAIQADMSALCALGVTRLSPDLVRANSRRAIRSALQPIRADLEMSPMPPSEQRTFSLLVVPWADSAERTINAILKSEVAAASDMSAFGGVKQT